MNQGQLKRYSPPFKDSDRSEGRCILLRPEVDLKVDLKKSNLKHELLVQIHGQMHAFVIGDKLTISTPSSKGEHGDLKILKQYGEKVWEMRFRKPMSQRILGVVPAKDIFVGIVMKPRSELNDKFGANATRCLDVWKTLCAGEKHELLNASDLNLALSNWRYG